MRNAESNCTMHEPFPPSSYPAQSILSVIKLLCHIGLLHVAWFTTGTRTSFRVNLSPVPENKNKLININSEFYL